MQAVLDTNPGNRCIVTTKQLLEHPSPNPRFHGLFMCFAASKEGFLNGCRPFIGIFTFAVCCLINLNTSTMHCNVTSLQLWFYVTGLDGCFIKLTTTGRDGNNNIFPIAFGVVDKEDIASWCWFLTQLKYCIGEAGKFGNYTIISDRQKVINSLLLLYSVLSLCDCNCVTVSVNV